MTPERLREHAKEWDIDGRYSIAEIFRAHAAALEEIERLKKERDAAFATSKCECESSECCNNLVKAQERADIDAHQLDVMREMAGANHAAWKQAERRAERLKFHADSMAARIEWYAEEGWVNGDIPEAYAYRAEFKEG